MGVGTNRINFYTVRRTTQALAQVLHRHFPAQPLRAIIGYDTRHHSTEFAQETAKVLAGNGIEALLFTHPQPLALVSFGIREEHAVAGVMITASHNPKEYNGYKVYMASGGQVLPPLDHEIMCENVEGIHIAPLNHARIRLLGEEQRTRYIECIRTLQLCPLDNRVSGAAIRLIYSPLHGTGGSFLPKVLKDWGFTRIHLVESQLLPDGDFPTVDLPNPEEREALALGIQQLIQEQGDLFIATDPDADRLGVVCMDHGEPYIFNGNQIACLIAAHVLTHSSLSKHEYIVKSLVTTELLSALALDYGVSIVNVGTGFKYIGEKIELWRNGPERFLFGAEESFGYLCGNHVEDKDAISSSAILAEAALQAKLQGKTLRDCMLALYERYGYYISQTESFLIKGSEALSCLLERLKSIDPKTMNLQERRILRFEDYSQRFGMCFESGSSYPLEIPKTFMLCYYYERGGKIILRPSGTEPKVKLYAEIVNRYDCPAQDREMRLQRERESLGVLEEFILAFKKQFLLG